MHKLLMILFLLLCFKVNAQKVVTGTILADNTNTIQSGVEVNTRISKATAVTDRRGTFAISVYPTDTLDLHDVQGNRMIFALNENTVYPLHINFKATIMALEEVVVNTGYQRIPKERATGSFTTLTKEVLNQQSGTTVLSRLESITNALYIDRSTGGSSGTSGKIIIRGLSTIQGPREPLIILDDFPYEGNFNNINPNDIENITVLKDAAAASIWGTRAGNGVIVITTKKGRFNQHIKVSFSSNMLITTKPELNYLKQMNAEDFVSVERFLYDKGFYNSTLSSRYLPVSPVVELLNQVSRGIITQAEADQKIAEIQQGDFRAEAERYLYNKGYNFQQALNLSGGSNTMAWTLAAGWDRNNDISGNKYSRHSLRSGQEFKISKNFSVATGIDYTLSYTKSGRPSYQNLRPSTGIYPVYTRLADVNGNAIPVFSHYRSTYIDTAGGGLLQNWNYYPLTDYTHVKNKTDLQALLLNIGLNYNFQNGFRVSMKYQYGKQTTANDVLYDGESYMARDLQNMFAQVDPGTRKVNYVIPRGGILDNISSSVKTHNVRGQIDYNNQWDRHRLDAIIGSEYREVSNDGSSFRTYGYNPSLGTTSNVDMVSFFPIAISGDQMQIPDNRFVTGRLNRFISFYGNAAYTLDDKYTISASARRDASNLFGAKQNNKWTPLWSVGAGWKINSFYKLRATYGSSGNADPARSAVTTIFYSGVSPYTNAPIARIDQYKNDQLSWEKVKMMNIGIDFNILRTRVQGSVEYYYKKASDLFGTTPIDYTSTGNTLLVKNVATISGHGWDLALNSRNLTGKIGWTTQLNFNLARDKVKSYYLTNKSASSFTLGSAITAVEGRPVYALYGYQWAGLDSVGAPQGYYQGLVTKNYTNLVGADVQYSDLKYMGPTLPVVTASLGNTISWNNISFTFRIVGKFGHWFQRTSIDYTDLLNNRVGHPDYELRWQKRGDELHTSVPAFIYPNNRNRNTFYRGSEILATRADYIRLQYITLSYRLKKPSTEFYINLNDLGLLWRANDYDIDPEYRNNLPPSVNIALGFRTNF